MVSAIALIIFILETIFLKCTCLGWLAVRTVTFLVSVSNMKFPGVQTFGDFSGVPLPHVLQRS